MFKRSPVLYARLRLTTKQVNGGYYKGNKTGSMGAHTPYGGYIIDWRKVRHFNVPELADFSLTPFVTREMQPTSRAQVTAEGITQTPKKVDAMEYLRLWKQQNPEEYDLVIKHQEGQAFSSQEEVTEIPEESDTSLGEEIKTK